MCSGLVDGYHRTCSNPGMDDDQDLRQQLFGRRLAARRDTQGLSQQALANRIGVRQSAVGNWESGTRIPRWPELRALAHALDVPAAWLVEPLTADYTGPAEGTGLER